MDTRQAEKLRDLVAYMEKLGLKNININDMDTGSEISVKMYFDIPKEKNR